jgi:hypothetical protein
MNKPLNFAWKTCKDQLTLIALPFLFFLISQSFIFCQERTLIKENGAVNQAKKEDQIKKEVSTNDEMLALTIKRIELKQNELSKIQDMDFLARYAEKLNTICPNIPSTKTFNLTHDQLENWLKSHYTEGSEYINLLIRIEEDWKFNYASEN